MQLLRSILLWFSGGAHQYHVLTMCMMHDYFWITLTVALDLLVAAGYVIIAYHWSTNERQLQHSPARLALRTMRNIFLLCGVCGYLFIPIKMFWPAWRLYDFVMLGLVFYTWRYALNALNFKVIYTAIGRSGKLEEDLVRSQDESRRKSFFLNAISHDLRTPLNGLLLHANLAEIHAEGGDQSGVKQSIAEIKTSVRLTAELLDGLLEFARLETSADNPNVSSFKLDDLLRDVVSSHHPLAVRKSLSLNTAPDTGLTLTTDRLRLERILNNLVGNAIKFTTSGSIHFEVQASTNQVDICVVDTGIGIAPEHQERLFEEFYQVQNHERDRQKGFGLGLAISSRLAQQLGGDLRVHSVPGQGSRFTAGIPTVLAATRIQNNTTGKSDRLAQSNGHPASAVSRGRPGERTSNGDDSPASRI